MKFASMRAPNAQLFEKKYITIRDIEDRMYTDEQLARLPQTDTDHSHHREWVSRGRSCNRLVHYLGKKNRPLRILEVGCGNGWLCNQLSVIAGARITGLDINFTELQQAARVFSDASNIKFIHGDLDSELLHKEQWDIIIFADSIQYFSPLRRVIRMTLNRLAPGGELHILDTPFYDGYKLILAQRRMAEYFSSLGFPEMSAFYFFHSRKSLSHFNPKPLFNPFKIPNLLRPKSDQFPWYCIKKQR